MSTDVEEDGPDFAEFYAAAREARWTLYVSPATYLPVRIYGSTETSGGSAGSFTSSFVTNVQWLPPTPANVAQTLITIPRGFDRVSSRADQ